MKDFLKKIMFQSKFDGYNNPTYFERIANMCLRFVAGFPLFIRNNIKFNKVKESNFSSDNRPLYILAIMKNEGNYLAEWLQYHIDRGVTKFILYDNESTDDTKKIIDKFQGKVSIDYHYWPGENQQKIAYTDAVNRYRMEHIWLLTIDIDEFLFPVNNFDILQWLNKLPSNIAQVLVGWRIYGSNNHINRPEGLVVQNYLRRAKDSYISDYKSIIKPDMTVSAKNPHIFDTIGKIINTSKKRQWYYPYEALIGSEATPKDKFVINHYYDKSLEDYKGKIKKGDAFDTTKQTRSMDNFVKQDRNEVFDEGMVKFGNQILNELDNNE
ncbi:glycosyltransferase family 2 protein [Latilactobacillus curvatus]|uniref:glycosyltransferase family 2 protein n=1 Tax=Latilactobacillus curvatus TaxID=28038 RepID=UPI003CE6FA08